MINEKCMCVFASGIMRLSVWVCVCVLICVVCCQHYNLWRFLFQLDFLWKSLQHIYFLLNFILLYGTFRYFLYFAIIQLILFQRFVFISAILLFSAASSALHTALFPSAFAYFSLITHFVYVRICIKFVPFVFNI